MINKSYQIESSSTIDLGCLYCVLKGHLIIIQNTIIGWGEEVNELDFSDGAKLSGGYNIVDVEKPKEMYTLQYRALDNYYLLLYNH